MCVYSVEAVLYGYTDSMHVHRHSKHTIHTIYFLSHTRCIDPTPQMWMQLREYMSTNPRPNFNLATQRSDAGNSTLIMYMYIIIFMYVT